MKSSQLEEGRLYESRNGNVRRFINQLTATTVYYTSNEDHYVRNLPRQEFASWARRKIPGNASHLRLKDKIIAAQGGSK